MLRDLSGFFRDDTGALSMSRLLCFLAFFPASYIVIHTGATLLNVFLGAFGPGVYGVGKVSDMVQNTWGKPGITKEEMEGE